jgi:apolipoprotein N-acyltransferase
MRLASSLFRGRFSLAIVAGLLLAMSFPLFGIAGFAWLAPGLLVAAGLGTRGWERFRIGFVGGLTYYLVALYWLLLIPYRWHGIPLGPAAGWLALGAFLALFPATWVWLCVPKRARDPAAEKSANFGLWTLDLGLLSLSWPGRFLWCLSGAAVWVALEMLIARIFTGFPWDLLGVSQYRMVPLIQIASITGVYGISFLVVWGSLSLLCAAFAVLRQPTVRYAWLGETLVPLVTIFALFAFGIHQIRHRPPVSRRLKVTFVQPSIPQTLIWDESRDDERFQQLIHLSEEALTNKPDLLLWPEAAVPKLLRWDKATFSAVTNLAGSHHVWLIVGADDMEVTPAVSGKEHRDYFNSSFLISPDGHLVNSYHKRALVIFGEYIPLVTWLPFIKWFTPIEGGFTSGDRAIPFNLTNLDVTTSVLICFEDVFPHLAREYADPDTDFLVNLTNNGWFGEGAAQWQHATSALFRAVENGLPLLRCSNNGLTCWVDANGRIWQIFHDENGRVYGPGCMTAEIPLLAPGELRARTFYNQHGDWFGWICAGWGILMMGREIYRSRKLRETAGIS